MEWRYGKGSGPGERAVPGGPLQAKPAAAPAPHVARAMAAGRAGAVQAKTVAAPAPAPHVRTAIAAHRAPPGSAQAKQAPLPPPHVAAAVAAGRNPGAAQARPAAPLPQPAAHLAAALYQGQAAGQGAVQAMKRKATVDRKETVRKKRKLIDDTVEQVNREIRNNNPKQQNFFEYKGTGILTQPVNISKLKKAKLKLDSEQSGLSNLSFGVKQLEKVGPEVQFGIVENTQSGSRKIRISANESKFNQKIRKRLPKSGRLEDLYREELRKKNVENRRQDLEKHSQKLSQKQVNESLDFAFGIESNDKEDFLQILNYRLGQEVHSLTRKNDQRRRAKSARKMAYDSHKDLEIEVVTNEKNIHAESAIVLETLKNPHEKLRKVAGTKVPCISCTTLFRKYKVEDAILDHTSGAWLSESSMTQLGFKPNEIEGYLRHIHSVIGKSTIYQHSVKSGEISVKQQTVDDDPSSDSEDEDATQLFEFGEVTNKSGRDRKAQIKRFVKKHF